MASAIETAILRHRRALLAGDARALAAMTRAYAPIRAGMIALIDDLIAEIARDGLTDASAVFRLQRATLFFEQVEGELLRLAQPASAFLTEAQRQAVNLATAQARALVAAQDVRIAARFTRLPREAMQDLVGRLSDGSPLRSWLDDLGTQTSETIQGALREGLALGKHPRAIAADLAGQVDVAGGRLLTITRTEVLNSYRGASLASYRANEDILDGWIWVASIGPRTCAACLSLSGEKFGLDIQFMPTHPACRCSPVPSLRGVDAPDIPSGADWFAEQPAKVQDGMLGKQAGTAYRNGEVALSDFAQLRSNRTWGDAYTQGSLKEAQATAARRERSAA